MIKLPKSPRIVRSGSRLFQINKCLRARVMTSLAPTTERNPTSNSSRITPFSYANWDPKSYGGSDFDQIEPMAQLSLSDGSIISGKSFGAAIPEQGIEGELVFTTGMVGYVETLTDPSYRGQIVVLTYPLVGNYGVPDTTVCDKYNLPLNVESDRIQVAGVIVQDYSHMYSHWEARGSLADWLKREGVPALHSVDTRMLTKKIRSTGTILGRIQDADAPSGQGIQDPNARNLVAEVSTKTVREYGIGNPHKILVVDCGIKFNMIRELCDRGAHVKLVPWDHDIMSEREWYDGLFITNGPGDPTVVRPLIDQLRSVLQVETKPIFGICMGNQLIGLAAGARAFKMNFGHRGHNQPVKSLLDGRAFITPQNHGYAIDTASLSSEWQPLFVNVNDGTNEGIMHKTKPFFTAQFHPEAYGGPEDTSFLFDTFMDAVANKRSSLTALPAGEVKKRAEVKKVLLLGSGGLSIGQAGEFDYSGSQAIKALKEEGIEVVLMNPNIASVQTNLGADNVQSADNVYFLPVTPDFIEMVIKRERPDGILINMGGQTALNCGVELQKRGVFDRYGVKVLGTPISAIEATEDRDTFAQKLKEIGVTIAPSIAVSNVEDALKAAESIGYPVMIRSAFALGGMGSGICEDARKLKRMARTAFATTNQILVEASLKGWKEVEYEVVCDAFRNCITVCNMENFDPLGVHTGESVVVAPSQTLNNAEYHMLRTIAQKVVKHLGIIGECNIQYALHPQTREYCVIEVNARLSRSSALASKATGYPLAAVAAKLSLGVPLPEVMNAVTKETTACFEPSMDYVVTKMPRWDMAKFDRVSRQIGTAMKSVGEVMAIGRGFEESFQKALRMVDPSNMGFDLPGLWDPRISNNEWPQEEDLIQELTHPTDRRVFALADILYNRRMPLERINELSHIDRWFLYRLQRIVNFSNTLLEDSIDAFTFLGGGDRGKSHTRESYAQMLLGAKRLGFSDFQIGQRFGLDEKDARALRLGLGVRPVVKQIDTTAAEYPAHTNYLYVTYNGSEDDVIAAPGGICVLGSGAYRIGSSVEFDWCSVSAIRALRNFGERTIVINYNPETVSTDYDECDRLYFEELSHERVCDIYDREAAKGVIVSVGGQIPNNIALKLHKSGVNVLGTRPEDIDRAEDRHKFSQMIDSIGLTQPQWRELVTLEDAQAFAAEVGYPVLVRPSYVLSGAAMSVAFDAEQLREVLEGASIVSPDHPVVITRFYTNAQEIEFDGVAKDGRIIAHAISEHVEKAGVHSGDATLILPTQNVAPYYTSRVRDIAARVAEALRITGPFNMQLLASGAEVSIIECNVRASRSFPFVSKTIGVDFIDAATRAIMGQPTDHMRLPDLTETDGRPQGYVGIKAPMFSFPRLAGADPMTGVEMASTGEVACFGENASEALLKALVASGFRIPPPQSPVLLCIHSSHHSEAVHGMHALAALGHRLYATDATHAFAAAHGIATELIKYPNTHPEETDESALLDLITSGHLALCVNIPNAHSTRRSQAVDGATGLRNAWNYEQRRAAVDAAVPLVTNLQLFNATASALLAHKKRPLIGLQPESLFDHYAKETEADVWSGMHEFH